MSEMTLLLTVHAILEEGHGIRLIDLRQADGGDLPPFLAGAHIDLALGCGLVRQYSLLNDQSERHRYMIAVARDAASRGGSIWLHDTLAVGDTIGTSLPRSHFALDESADFSILIAGGIGITPIWSMAQRLAALGKEFELHYGARSPASAALLQEVETLASPGTVVATYFSDGAAGRMADIAALVETAPPGTHFYCCGPAPMLDSFRAACATVPPGNIHLEQFTAAAPVASDGGFTIALARTGREIDVEPGQTILDALKAAGLRANYSCREGVCGSCETAVLEGTPDHRDAVLTDAERAEGKTMMICCSGSLSSRLVLDL